MRRSWGWAGLASALFFLVSCGGGADSSVSQASAQRLTSSAKPLSASKTPLAANVVDNTALFTWAQWHYSHLFTGGYQSGNHQDQGLVFNYRYYPSTGHYLGIASGNVYVLGPVTGGNIFFAGSLASFNCLVFPANCPVTAPAASNAEALAGFYYADSTLGWMAIDVDSTFIGYNQNASGTRAWLYAGNATAQANTWSASNVTFGTYLPGNAFAVPATAEATASYIPATSLTATFVVGGAAQSRPSMVYHPQSTSPASLAIVGGLYSWTEAGQSILIDPNTGSVSGMFINNSAGQCAVSGSLSVTSALRNIYKLQLTFSGNNCSSVATGPGQYLAFYEDLGIEEQTLRLYGVTTSGDLNFVQANFVRSGF